MNQSLTSVVRRCPRCGSERLQPVETAGGYAHLVCISCHRCWQFEGRFLVEVNRYACSGCADRRLCQVY